MKHWRWYLIGAAVAIVFATAPSVIAGFTPAGMCLILWAIRMRVVMEPKWSIDDELAEISSWT